MRIIPNRSRHAKNKSNKEQTSEDPQLQHRRSWHVGTSAVPADSNKQHRRHKGRKAERRPSGGKRHKTWHFFRASRHSSHSRPGYSYEHQEDRHFLHHKEFQEEEKEEQIFDSEGFPEQRKTFKRCERVDEGDNSSSSNQHKKKGKDNWFKRVRRRTGRFFRSVEEFLFPGCPINFTHHSGHGGAPRIRGGVLLQSCQTADEHRAKVQEVVSAVRNLHGAEGLRAIGLEYRFLPCPEHGGAKANDNQQVSQEDENPTVNNEGETENVSCTIPDPLRDSTDSTHQSKDHSSQQTTKYNDNKANLTANNDQEQGEQIDCTEESTSTTPHHLCEQCSTQLFHIESNTRICIENRKLFIADGDMYDVIGRLCQENAHELMQRKFFLQWVTVCTPEEDDHHPLKRNSHEAIRALVNPEHPLLAAENPGNVSEERLRHFSKQPTLLIITGKGKVRAGIFSRFHIMSNGIESSTAIPLIQEARFRELNIVMIDPNVHGESLGMVTFEKSMAKLFHFWERDPVDEGVDDQDENDLGPDGESRRSLQPFTNRDLYILSHSASGSHLARYLMDKTDHYLPHIRAIAFTDSTHNIQWVRQREKHDLARLLESPACVYFRCASEDKDANWHKHRAGEEAPRDTFWRHRFGDIKTCWAGTKEHALTNWFAHRHIWEHFDTVLYGGPQKTEVAEVEQH